MSDENLEIHRAGGAGAGGGDATEAKQDVIIAEVTNLDGDAMRGTDNAALAATALSDAIWTNAKAALIEAMRGTDNGALAATALTDATWTNAKAAFLDASISAIPTTAQRGTDNAALASVCLEARLVELAAANLPADVDAIKAETDIRRIASGSKTIGAAATKYLSIDSGTNGAEIIGLAVKGVVGHDWTLDVYVPTADAVAAPAAGDKRDTNEYLNTDAEAGMLDGFAIFYNCFLDFTNDGAEDNIDDVVILYRSSAVLTLAWEA